MKITQTHDTITTENSGAGSMAFVAVFFAFGAVIILTYKFAMHVITGFPVFFWWRFSCRNGSQTTRKRDRQASFV